mgnify:CR=1 FL=1
MAEVTDAFTMDNIQGVSLDPLTGGDAPEKVDGAPEKSSGEPKAEESKEKPESFVEAFARAKKGEPEKGAEEPEPEPEKAAEPEEPDSKKPESRSAKDFKSIKSERDSLKNEIESLRKKIDVAGNDDSSVLVKQLREERDEMSNRLKSVSIENHPEFQKYYNTKTNSIIESARTTAGEHADRAEQVLRMADTPYRTAQIEEMFGELSPAAQAKMGALVARLDELGGERAAQLADAQSTYEQMAAEQQASGELRVVASEKVFDEVLGEARNLEVFQPREDDNEWNEEIDKRVDIARKTFLGQSNERELARQSCWAAAAPKYRELLVSQLELNRRLNAQIQELNGAAPSVVAGGGSDDGGSAEPKSFVERYMELTGS